MSSRIAELLQGNRYDEALVPELEAYVAEQRANGSHDFDANLCLIKLYMTFPQRLNAEVVDCVVKKAMTALPEPCVLQCRYLVPEKLQKEEPLCSTLRLASFLEEGRFAQFWAEGGSDVAAWGEGMLAALHKVVLTCMSRLNMAVAVGSVAQALNVGEQEVAQVVQQSGVDAEIRDGMVQFAVARAGKAAAEESSVQLQSVEALMKQLAPLTRL